MMLMVPGMFVFFAWLLGLFSTVEINTAWQEPQTLVVKKYRGDYQRLGKTIIEMQGYLKRRGIGCKPVALYLDDNKKVIKKLLRSQGGCVVSNKPPGLDEGIDVVELPREQKVIFTIDAHPSVALTKLMNAVRKYHKSKNKQIPYPLFSTYTEEGHMQLRASL